jgi:hypothetical protein
MRPAFVISFPFERFEVAPPAEGSTVEQELAAAEAHIAGHHIAGHHTAEELHTVADKRTAVAVRQRRVADSSLDPAELAAHNPAEKDSIAVDTLAPADSLDTASAQASGFRQHTAREN